MMRVSDAIISVSAVLMLLATLVMLDDRVRDQLSYRLLSHPTVQLANAGVQVRDLTTVIVEAAADQTVAHAPMMGFVLAGIVLFLFMTRT